MMYWIHLISYRRAVKYKLYEELKDVSGTKFMISFTERDIKSYLGTIHT